MAATLFFKAFAFMAITTLAAAETAANCWQYQGCYDQTTAKPLANKVIPSTTEDTNNENCQSACLAAGYLMSGTANAFECWCDNSINTSSSLEADSYCNDPCNTVTTEMCGGYLAVSVWDDTCLAVPPAPVTTYSTQTAPTSSSTYITSKKTTSVPSSKTFYITTSVPASVHTVYTTVVVTAPTTTQVTTIQTTTQVTTIQTTTLRRTTTARISTTSTAQQPGSTCNSNDIACCLFDPNCNTDIFSLVVSPLGVGGATKVKRTPQETGTPSLGSVTVGLDDGSTDSATATTTDISLSDGITDSAAATTTDLSLGDASATLDWNSEPTDSLSWSGQEDDTSSQSSSSSDDYELGTVHVTSTASSTTTSTLISCLPNDTSCPYSGVLTETYSAWTTVALVTSASANASTTPATSPQLSPPISQPLLTSSSKAAEVTASATTTWSVSLGAGNATATLSVSPKPKPTSTKVSGGVREFSARRSVGLVVVLLLGLFVL